MPSSDRAAATGAFDAGKGAGGKASGALQANALDPLMEAVKDMLSSSQNSAEEHARLCGLLTANIPFFISVFRYYYQGLKDVWNAASPLQAAAGASLGDERIAMCAASARAAVSSRVTLLQARRLAHAKRHTARVQELQVLNRSPSSTITKSKSKICSIN